MSYSRGGMTGLGTLYAAAGLGALGFDRLATNRTRMFVFSIANVPGLASGQAPAVPGRIIAALNSGPMNPGGNANVSAAADWASGGRVWGRYTLPLGSSLIDNAAGRRAALRGVLEQAARSLGPNVSFEITGVGRIPASAPAAPPSAPPPVVTELEPIDISGGGVNKSVTELQTLLLSKGFNPGTVDGKWGPAPRARSTRPPRLPECRRKAPSRAPVDPKVSR